MLSVRANIHVVVMAGGAGTRFWPVSRRHRPKQLLKLGSDTTLLEQTFRRVAPLAPPQSWWMVVGASHAADCADAVPEVPRAQVLVEPCARNTAAAIALAALHVYKKDPKAVMVVLPADHYVRDAGSLCEALSRAADLAAQGPIVTLGIEPTRPETGYGYIERGEPDGRVPNAFAVRRFCEKPSSEKALELLRAGTFVWNAGIFVLLPRIYEAELEAHMPKLHAAMRAIAPHVGGPDYEQVLAAHYEPLAATSVDYGVMEKARDVAVLPVACGWSDVGSWSALAEVVAPRQGGNVIQGRAVVVDSRDSIVYAADGHVVALVGLNNVVVVHTQDATLVVPKDRAQEVRTVIEGLTSNGWTDYL